jgi:hypothetical protein
MQCTGRIRFSPHSAARARGIVAGRAKAGESGNRHGARRVFRWDDSAGRQSSRILPCGRLALTAEFQAVGQFGCVPGGDALHAGAV